MPFGTRPHFVSLVFDKWGWTLLLLGVCPDLPHTHSFLPFISPPSIQVKAWDPLSEIRCSFMLMLFRAMVSSPSLIHQEWGSLSNHTHTHRSTHTCATHTNTSISQLEISLRLFNIEKWPTLNESVTFFHVEIFYHYSKWNEKRHRYLPWRHGELSLTLIHQEWGCTCKEHTHTHILLWGRLRK